MKILIKNTSSNVKQLGFEDFEEITKSDKPYVIKFYNPTCHLCKELKPIYEEIANEFKDKFKFGQVNTRANTRLSKLFHIDGVPELFIVNNQDVFNIPYPEDNPDPKSGYSKQYIIQHLENYNESA